MSTTDEGVIPMGWNGAFCSHWATSSLSLPSTTCHTLCFCTHASAAAGITLFPWSNFWNNLQCMHPYMAYTQPCHPPNDQPSNKFNSPVAHSSSHSKPSTLRQASCGVRTTGVGDVATDLELKTPGSSGPSHSEITTKVRIVFNFI